MRKVAMAWFVVLLVGLGLGTDGRAAPPPTTLEVGDKIYCDYHTIADAIAGANTGDTIKVQNRVYYESPLVVNKKLTLVGGYVQTPAHLPTCLTTTGAGVTTVRPATLTTSPLLSVQGAQVTVNWFVFEDNNYGRGVAVDNGELYLEDVVIQDNEGGLKVEGGGTAHLLATQILANDDDYGGGIHITGGSAVLASDSLVRGNSGWQEGAGVYVSGGSSFTALNGTSIEHNRTVSACERGGGIYAGGTGTEVTLNASTVISNTALQEGGGLYVDSGAIAVIQNNSAVQENIAYGPVSGLGGGVHVRGPGSTLHVLSSQINNNWADPSGGGIYNHGGTVQLRSSLVWSNHARDSGGGLYNRDGAVHARDSIFYLNDILNLGGGGVYSAGADARLDIGRTWFIQNSAGSGDGGGLFAWQPEALVDRSYFVANVAPSDGSGLFLSAAGLPGEPWAEVTNCYIVDNTTVVAPVATGPATLPGVDGLQAWPGLDPLPAIPRLDGLPATPATDGSPAPTGVEGPPAGGSSLHAEYIRAVLVHNTFAQASPIDAFGVHVGPSSRVEMTNNIVTNFYSGIYRVSTGTGTVTASYTLFWGNTYENMSSGSGMVNLNPVYGDPSFAGTGWFYQLYELTAPSAAINSGTDGGIYVDFEGFSRPWDGGFDIGADEYPDRVRLFLPLVARRD